MVSYVCFPRWLSGKKKKKKICLAVQETQKTRVQSQGWENSLEKEMAPHSSIFTWESPWTEEPGGLHSTGSQKSQT